MNTFMLASKFLIMSMDEPCKIPPDQAWFWTPEWQAKEREADEDIAAGRVEYFDSSEDFLAALAELASA